MQHPFVILLESATCFNMFLSVIPISPKVVGNPISFINLSSSSIPLAAISSSLKSLLSTFQTSTAKQANLEIFSL